MSNRSRMPGPISTSTTGNQRQLEQDGLLRWKSIDLRDGTWSSDAESDFPNGTPTGLVQAITSSSAGMRIQTDNADSALVWNDVNQTSPRYYKKLQGPGAFGGLSWLQKFSIEFLCTRSAIGANDGDAGSGNNKWDGSGIVVGIGDSTCVEDASGVRWTGAGFYNNQGSSSVLMRYGGDSGVSDLANSASVSGYHLLSVNIDATDADGNTQLVRGAGYIMNSSGQVLSTAGMTSQTHEFIGTHPVYIFVSPTYYTTVSNIDTDTDTTWKLWYRIRVAMDDLAPDYVAGGGYSGLNRV